MIDIETLGVRPGCVVWEIGGVSFDRESFEIKDEFSISINPEDAQEWGLVIEPETEDWWESRGGIILTDPADFTTAFLLFSAWMEAIAPARVWSCGTCFERPILEACYDRLGLPLPYHFGQGRDLRTAWDLAFPEVKRPKADHRALADCRKQVGELKMAVEWRSCGAQRHRKERIMKTLQWIKLMMIGMDERLFRIEKRLGASGSSPASCSESRVAATGQDAYNNSPPQLRHSETEEGVKVQRLVEKWMEEAADHRDHKFRKVAKGDVKAAAAEIRLEAVCIKHAAELAYAFHTETPDESEAGGVEEDGLSSEDLEMISKTLTRARSDIWQTARVSETNLTGIDPCRREDGPIFTREKPTLIHRAGIDDSYQVIKEIESVQRMISRRMDSRGRRRERSGSGNGRALLPDGGHDSEKTNSKTDL